MMGFYRIKERKLFRWGFAWPDRVMRAATVLLGISYFGVLVLAWSRGKKGRQKAGGVELLA